MTDPAWIGLRQLLVERYDDFRKRLTRRLGSAELARETLHETWLHLHRAAPTGTIASPPSYLLRIAFNIATDRGRKQSRLARRTEVMAVLDMADDAPSAERELAARQEISELEAALEELTPRRRMILLASRVEEATLQEIAQRLGVSQRLVEIELKHALDHCAERLQRQVVRRFGPKPRETSIN
ncbi:RNA polymerase sigma factor [Tardiphaga robiniae]|uniref:RNA polymerase n=1 Tax=Tardiphaga robiniae TaxID=943830 RepID=A0A164A074_9BRAD|nr:sigma-70 family RNA polymerase sigma factor [Tardiphaga robiniae]KZD24067.1 RNA polymerase [Tardiphaga robiniae]